MKFTQIYNRYNKLYNIINEETVENLTSDKNQDITNNELFVQLYSNIAILNSNGYIDVNGDVKPEQLAPFIIDNKLTIRFNEVIGNFDCSYSKLISLDGCPEIVGGSFHCHYNYLTTLKGCPEIINGTFGCRGNKLANLVGGPEIVKGNYYCYDNPLTSLDGAPKQCEKLIISRNYKLTNVIRTQYSYEIVKAKIEKVDKV